MKYIIVLFLLKLQKLFSYEQWVIFSFSLIFNDILLACTESQSLPDSIHIHGFIALLITPINVQHSSLSHSSTFLFCCNMIVTSCQLKAVWIYIYIIT